MELRWMVTVAVMGAGCALATETMPAAQQNALVQKYCAVCHDDAHKNGGLTLQHFDAAKADPGIAAMLLSKLTNGLPLAKLRAAQSDPSAAAAIDAEMKSSAIQAAGAPAPEAAVSRAWVLALSEEARRATEWAVDGAGAGVIRETASKHDPARADMYRLSVACRADRREGEMRLAWAPGGPTQGQVLRAAADGAAPREYKVEGHETMGNTGSGNSGPGDVVLAGMPLPQRTLEFSNLVNGGRVAFSFDDLNAQTRAALAACFAAKGNAD